eukprot:363309-Chlamydomonas_euryale.AAC.19
MPLQPGSIYTMTCAYTWPCDLLSLELIQVTRHGAQHAHEQPPRSSAPATFPSASPRPRATRATRAQARGSEVAAPAPLRLRPCA